MSWIQQNLEWAVGLLLVGIIVLFFFFENVEIFNKNTKNNLDKIINIIKKTGCIIDNDLGIPSGLK